MQTQEFKFIYDDLKQQTKQIPHLQQMLRLTQKSTKKLQCINLYSVADKRDFDLEFEQQQIMEDIVKLYKFVELFKQTNDQKLMAEISQKIDSIKSKNIETFDLLNKQDQLLTRQIELVQYSLDDQHHENQIKQQDQFDQQNMKDSNPTTKQQKLSKLKKQIDDIGNKLAKINHGKGKWFLSDHNDFVKIYNKCGGNEKKIIEEGVKVLGMKNTQIIQHLEIYEYFLQLEKEKKIISEEYKQIKLMEKIQDDERNQKLKLNEEEKRRLKKQKQIQENQKKKQLIQKFKQKRNEQKAKMLEQQEKKQKQKIIKIPLPPSKKKQIIERNQKFITQKQNNFKKNIQQKNAINSRASLSRGKQRSIDKNIAKKQSN